MGTEAKKLIIKPVTKVQITKLIDHADYYNIIFTETIPLFYKTIFYAFSRMSSKTFSDFVNMYRGPKKHYFRFSINVIEQNVLKNNCFDI